MRSSATAMKSVKVFFFCRSLPSSYHDPEVYDYMKSYAPYENVTAQNYPDILAITSLNDTRVLYVEPAKWLSKKSG